MSAVDTVVEVTAKWQSSQQIFPFPLSSTVSDLHAHIAFLFNLAPTLKLVGLVKGKLPAPSTPLSSLSLPSTVRVLVVGTSATSVDELSARDAAFTAKRAEEERHEEVRRQQREAYQRAELERRHEQELLQAERTRAYQQQQAERERQRAAELERMERESRERELKEEQAGGEVSFTLNCMNSDEADSKAQLILPPTTLTAIVNAKVPFPLTFAIRRAVGSAAEEHKHTEDDVPGGSGERSEVLYAGVADFSSPAPSVVLTPASVMKALGVEEGAQLTLSTFTLPKATHITLLPLPSASTTPPSPSPFYALSPPERTALLEFHLRHRQMLQRGQVIDIQYRRGMEAMRFEVKDVQPGNVVSIIDTDVVTDVEGSDASEKDEKTAHTADGEEESTLQLDEEVSGELAQGRYSYWRAALDDVNSEYDIALRSLRGDADLYVAMAERTSVRPEVTAFDWRSVGVGDDRIRLSNEDARFRPGALLIAVHAYEADAAFTLRIRKQPKGSAPASFSSASSTASSSPTQSSGDTTVCFNCHKPIPSRSLAMHSVQCRRNNAACPQCGAVVLTRHLAKHIAMQHAAVPCPACGERVELPLMGGHRRETCVGRLVECAYCPLLLTAGERGEHSAEDGLFRSACKECGEVMQRKVMRRHMRLAHGRNEKDITWRDIF